ncbi:hypothetical protein EJ05DRAFT_498480 [Pseudovirgaria hyperparasitica]|uniref:Uncharacterized protein n=1 Tax=Pseudovirgaria hyperparasitica TaxID=470096 RepID=A0A6A6WF53_9PEZI|nr:uncharacterized protein EJ05DRAFT_498480 [Pseudovirgaria hyperparasitica]KAF2760516.1 hypothetical protein EJ05DRAFT_498480 [Pseudovirgaria hyperparasitica]
MRPLRRLHIVVACAFFFILYLGWVWPSLEVKTRLQKVFSGSARRIVVFGDDWSDIGTSPIAAPRPESVLIREPASGKIWTESLSKKLLCDTIDNFARDGSTIEHKDATANGRPAASSGRHVDLEEQVLQWIEHEKQRSSVPSGRYKKKEDTLFTIMFGLWDLLDYVHLSEEAGKRAIDSAVLEIFQQMDKIVDHANFPVRIVLPFTIDISLLPGFPSQVANSTSGLSLAQLQHHAMYLSTYWNTALMRAAMQWTGGDVFMPDLNHFVVSNVQSKQLWQLNLSDAFGNGRQSPVFNNVELPCLLRPDTLPFLENFQSAGAASHGSQQQCDEPTNHLFWDEMHLSGKANQLFGDEAASLVHENKTINANARHQNNADGEAETTNFTLILPPEELR